jgi:hypothetical protein
MIHYLLDFTRRRSVTVPIDDGAFMDRTATDRAIKVLLTEIHRRLDEAARIAKPRKLAHWRGASPTARAFRWISNNN